MSQPEGSGWPRCASGFPFRSPLLGNDAYRYGIRCNSEYSSGLQFIGNLIVFAYLKGQLPSLSSPGKGVRISALTQDDTGIFFRGYNFFFGSPSLASAVSRKIPSEWQPTLPAPEPDNYRGKCLEFRICPLCSVFPWVYLSSLSGLSFSEV